MSEFTKDLDQVLPPKRTFILAGKEYDVSVLPTRAVLRFMRYYEGKERAAREVLGGNPSLESIMKYIEQNSAVDDVEEIFGVVEQALKKKYPEVTYDYLMDDVDYEEANAFVAFVMKPILDKLQKKTDEKLEELKKQEESESILGNYPSGESSPNLE
jgi:hypothetical protein